MDEKATLRAATALKRLGLTESADAMRRSLDALPADATTAVRPAYVSENRARLAELFAPLDRIVWDVDFDAAAARDIDDHQVELIAGSAEFAALLRLQ